MLFISPVFGAGNFYGNGRGAQKEISITFDDGPDVATKDILDILDAYTVKAAFFMLGEHVARNPKLTREVMSRGHEICSHAYTHANYYRFKNSLPQELLDENIKKSLVAIQKETGITPRYVRIPHGYYRTWVGAVAAANNVDVVHWSFGCDWQNMTEEQMIQGYIKAITPGAIFLFHDGGGKRLKTKSILPRIIEEIRKKGYTIVSLEELLRNK
jgi:peptidoglycan/xylan/chitin deacetylase (PgdA/CDA1 family)